VLSKMSFASLLPPLEPPKLPRRLLRPEELVEAGTDEVTRVVDGGSALEEVAVVELPLPVSPESPESPENPESPDPPPSPLSKLLSPSEELEEPPKPLSKLLNGFEESVVEPEEPPRPLSKLLMRSEKLEEPPSKLPSPLEELPRPSLPIPPVNPVIVGRLDATEFAAVGREKAVGMAPPKKRTNVVDECMSKNVNLKNE
jgi:hypothetical protein